MNLLEKRDKNSILLKEVNGGEDWDLREFLREGGRKQTWDNVTRWVIRNKSLRARYTMERA